MDANELIAEKRDAKEAVLESIQNVLRGEFGSSLRAVVLFGSMVDQTKINTDFDVFVIVDRELGPRSTRVDLMVRLEDQMGAATSRARSFGGFWEVSLKLKTLEESQYFSPLYLDWVERSLILFEDDRKIATRLIEKTAGWIASSGAKKIQRGLLWYWNLLPDLKPGEERKIGW